MRRFFRRGALFVLPILAGWAGCEAGLSQVDHTIYSARKPLLARRAPEIRVLALGNSQAMVGVRPEFIRRPAFNLAHNAQDLYYNRELVRRFGGDLKNLELVVVCLSYFSLESTLSQNPEKWRECFYYRFYGIPHEDGRAGVSHAADLSWIALYGREESAKLALRGFRSRREKLDGGGWPIARHEEPSPESLPALGRVRIERHHSFMKPENLAYNLDQLRGMIEELRARNVRVALFSPPLTEAYRAHLLPAALERTKTALAGLCGPLGIPYADFTADARFGPSDFKDPDHLNPRGAERLSQILDEELIEPALRPSR